MNLSDQQVEQLAQAIHEQYCATWKASSAELGEPPTDSKVADKTWEELTDDQREANRDQARRIPQKLRSLDLVIRPVDGPDVHRLVLESEVFPSETQVVVLTEQRVQSLARQEHDEWMVSKEHRGWTSGDKFDEPNKVHNLLIKYDKLSPAQQRLDADPVRNLPALLKLVDMGVVPV